MSVIRQMELSFYLNFHKVYKHEAFILINAAGLPKTCRIFVTTHKSQTNPKYITNKAVII